jgi:hypothetical protein
MSSPQLPVDYDAMARQSGAVGLSPTPTETPNTAPVPQASTDQTQSLPDLNDLIGKAGVKYMVDPNLIHAIVKQESNYNPKAVSKKGAQGLMQLMPETSKRLGVKDPFDPQENLDGGVQHFKSLLGKYKGDVNLALAAYSAGEGAVTQYGGIPPYSETQDYIKKIVGEYQANQNPSAPHNPKPSANYDAIAQQTGATKASIDYDALAQQSGATAINDKQLPGPSRVGPGAIESAQQFAQKPVATYAEKALGFAGKTFSEMVDEWYPKTVYALTGKLVNKETGMIEGWEPTENPWIPSTAAKAVPGMIHDAAKMVAGLADFTDSPEGMANIILPIVTGGASLPFQAAYYFGNISAGLAFSLKNFHEHPNADTLQEVLQDGAMLAMIGHGGIKDTIKATTPGTPEYIAMTKTGEAITKPINAAREAVANIPGGVADALERRAETKDIVTQAQETSRQASLATAQKMVGAGIIDKAMFDKVKDLNANQLGNFIRRTFTDDAFSEALPERNITTTATKDGAKLRQAASQLTEDGKATLAKEKIFTDAFEDPNNAKIGTKLLQDLNLTTLENLDNAGQTAFADQAVSTVENHVFRKNALLPDPDSQIKGLMKDFGVMAENELLERSPRLKQEYQGLKALNDLNNAVKALKRKAPPGFNISDSIIGRLAKGKLFGYGILGVLLGHSELGGLGIGLSVGRWMLDRAPVLNAAAHICRGLEDTIRPEAKGTEAAVAPKLAEAPPVAPTAPTEAPKPTEAAPTAVPAPPIVAPVEAKPPETTPAAIPEEAKPAVKEEPAGKLIQEPNHSAVTEEVSKKVPGVKYEGTSKDGAVVWITDPRGETIGVPAEEFKNSDEVVKAVNENAEAQKELTHKRAVAGIAGNIAEKVAGTYEKERPSWITPDEYAEIQERYPGMDLALAKEQNDNVNRILKAQAEEKEAKGRELTKEEADKVAEDVIVPPKVKEAKTTTVQEAKTKADEEAALRREALNTESKTRFKTTYWNLDEDQQRQVVDAVEKAEAAKPPETKPAEKLAVPAAPVVPVEPVAGSREQLKAGTPEATAFINRFKDEHPDTKLTDDQIIKYNNDYGKLEFKGVKGGKDATEEVAKKAAEKLNQINKPEDNAWEPFRVETGSQKGMWKLRRYKSGVLPNEMNYVPGEEMPEEAPEEIGYKTVKLGKGNMRFPGPGTKEYEEELSKQPWVIERQKEAARIEAANKAWMDDGHKVKGLKDLPNSVFKYRLVGLLHELAGHAFSFMMDGIPIKEVFTRRNGGAAMTPEWDKLSLDPDRPFSSADTVTRVLGAIVDSGKGREMLGKGLAAGPAIDALLGHGEGVNDNPWRPGVDAYNHRLLLEALNVDPNNIPTAWEAMKKAHQELVGQFPNLLQNLVDYLVDPKHADRIHFNGKEIHKILADAAGIENPFEALKPVKEKLPTQKSFRFLKNPIDQNSRVFKEGSPQMEAANTVRESELKAGKEPIDASKLKSNLENVGIGIKGEKPVEPPLNERIGKPVNSKILDTPGQSTAVLNTVFMGGDSGKVGQTWREMSKEQLDEIGWKSDENAEKAGMISLKRPIYENTTAWEKKFRAKCAVLGINPAIYEKAISQIYEAQNLLLKRPDLLQHAEPGNPVHDNADFGDTLDFSASCIRRNRFIPTIEAIEKEIGRLLRPDERIAVNIEMARQGHKTPCPYCYVEQSRAHLITYRVKLFEEAGLSERLAVDPEYREAQFKKTPGLEKQYTELMKKRAANVNLPKPYHPYGGQFLHQTAEHIDEQNGRAGQRVQSANDFFVPEVIDKMQAIVDASLMQKYMHEYTKEAASGYIFGAAGMKQNLSIYGEIGPDGKLQETRLGGFPFATMPWADAMKLREMYPETCGTMLMAVNDEQIMAAFKDPRVDMIIGQHGKAPEQFKNMWQDYGHNEIDPKTGERRLPNEVPGEQREYWINQKNRVGKLQQVKEGKEINSRLHHNDLDTYLKLCQNADAPRLPRFARFIYSNVADVLKGAEPKIIKGNRGGYFKLIKDVARTEVPQRVVTPEFNMDALRSYIKQWQDEGGTDVTPVDGVTSNIVTRLKKGPLAPIQNLIQISRLETSPKNPRLTK